MAINLGMIAVGGALGTLFRYYLTLSTLFITYPLSTLLENWLGSFLLGSITGWAMTKKIKEWLHLGLGVGLCGGFTTMSTLAADSFDLSVSSSLHQSILYLILSFFGGIALSFLGFLIGQYWGRKRSNRREVKTE